MRHQLYNFQIGIFLVIMSFASYGLTMHKNKPETPGEGSRISTVGDMTYHITNNDGLQQLAGDIGTSGMSAGQSLTSNALQRHFLKGATMHHTQKALDNAQGVFNFSYAINKTAGATPHVGWIATTGGRAYEHDWSGAAIQGLNGACRTLVVAKVGSATTATYAPTLGLLGSIWLGGKYGATAGAIGGPLGIGAGFIVGAGAAWIAGKGWDNTIGVGADALDQQAANRHARSQYAGDGKSAPPVFRSDDPAIRAWVHGQDNVKKTSDKDLTNVQSPIGLPGVTPQKVTAVFQHQETYPYKGRNYVENTRLTLEFWNVGALVKGYETVTGKGITTITGIKGTQNISCTGTFTGGPEGTFEINCESNELTINLDNGKVQIVLEDDWDFGTLKMSKGRRISCPEGTTWTVQNPDAFRGWPQ